MEDRGADLPGTVSFVPGEHHDERLRVAIVASPRSGNTWLRGLLASTFELSELAVLSPEAVPWENLPARLVLQIHWHAIEPFRSQLRDHGFHVVTLARHPLDLFISSLNYQQYVEETLKWMRPEGERTLRGASPRSEVFLDFACGWVGENLHSTTREWWQAPGTICVRYEDLVDDTAGELQRLVQALGAPVRRPIEQVIAAYGIDRLRIEYGVWHYHYWQGKPGHWKTLLPAREAQQIAAVHGEAFEAMRYVCDPDPDLSEEQADLNWFRVQCDSVRQHLEAERTKHAQTRKVLEAERAQIAMVHETLAEARSAATAARETVLELRRRHRAARRALASARDGRREALARLHELEEVKPLSVVAPPLPEKGAQRQAWLSATMRRFIPRARETA
jgi:hypothetical protein